MLSQAQIDYLIDFITETLREDIEDDPFDEEEVTNLLEIKKALKAML